MGNNKVIKYKKQQGTFIGESIIPHPAYVIDCAQKCDEAGEEGLHECRNFKWCVEEIPMNPPRMRCLLYENRLRGTELTKVDASCMQYYNKNFPGI